MSGIGAVLEDIRRTVSYRIKLSPWIKRLDRDAPKAGDVAPDFTLSDVTGTESVTLSDFRDSKPVVLFFGSYT
jgi:hypothetical protein